MQSQSDPYQQVQGSHLIGKMADFDSANGGSIPPSPILSGESSKWSGYWSLKPGMIVRIDPPPFNYSVKQG